MLALHFRRAVHSRSLCISQSCSLSCQLMRQSYGRDKMAASLCLALSLFTPSFQSNITNRTHTHICRHQQAASYYFPT
ncbi:hypothetical protein TGAM01_v211119 [Trichoderma gamsii]|uniref:Uncharacterized protein n=1 Tax=Trichoderma gamsii TaxID=398673 RepID=A0A2P4Z6V7_9HYPO|nr:hypothetical protein TGAM01_v211119 [Trichoderma gamsii]PON20012.1 hypothetical protein TGAM01_v211119 [Trichoderma gamsii]